MQRTGIVPLTFVATLALVVAFQAARLAAGTPRHDTIPTGPVAFEAASVMSGWGVP